MRRFMVFTALVVTLTLSVFAGTAQAGENTGWPCGPTYGSYYGQTSQFPGGYYYCSGYTHTWLRFYT